METHAHHLHKAPGHNIWHYLFEFLMLFLAVFCGFLAENIRENKVEKDREKVYMKNMLEDLKSDTASYAQYNRSTLEFLNKIDSLAILLTSPDRNAHINKIYYFARSATLKVSSLYPNERTFDQMKYSGHLRLIGNQKVADSTSNYYNSLKGVTTQNDIILARITTYMQGMGKVFDARLLMKIMKEGKEQNDTSARLITNDFNTINEFLTNAQYFYGARMLQNNWAALRSVHAQNLIELIKKEYDFE